MGKTRERQIVVKTDRRLLILELGDAGKFQVKSSGWDEVGSSSKAMFLKLRYAMAGRPAREADAMTFTPIAPQGSTEPHGRPTWAQVETKLTRDRGSPQQSTSAPPAEGAKDLLGTLTPSCDSVTRRHRRNVQRRFSLSLLHHRIGEEEGDGVRLLVVVGASDALDCCSWRRKGYRVGPVCPRFSFFSSPF